MRKLILSLLFTAFICTAQAITIDGIYYSLNSENSVTVMVDSEYDPQTQEFTYHYYTGQLNIPATITFEDKTYTVNKIFIYGCKDLTGVSLPNTIEEIYEAGFYGCEKLTSIALPSSLKKIGRAAFSFSGLKEVTIPSSVEIIEQQAFGALSTLERVNIADLAAWCSVDVASGAFDTNENLRFYVDGKLLTDLVIPNEVTTISPNVFNGFKQLQTVTIHENVDSIGDNAFFGCSGLTRVNISDLKAWCHIRFGETYQHQLVSISSVANPLFYAQHLFINGNEPTELSIPEGTERIGNGAFAQWKTPVMVHLPQSLHTIDRFAFQGCTSINKVYVPSLRSYCDIDFVSIESNPLTPNKNQFTWLLYDGNTGDPLMDLTIPNGVTEIKPFAFAGMLLQEVVNIPASVRKIGKQAFYDNYFQFKQLNIFGHVAEIDENAFGNCTALASPQTSTINVYDAHPAAISEMAFYNTRGGAYGPYPSDVIYGGPLHVPVGAKATYEQTAGWSQFKTIVEDEAISSLANTQKATGQQIKGIYTLDGRPAHPQRKGLLIIKQANGETKKVIR